MKRIFYKGKYFIMADTVSKCKNIGICNLNIMNEGDLIVGSKILKIPQKARKPVSQEYEDCPNTLTISPSSKKIGPSVLTHSLMFLIINGSSSMIVYIFDSKSSSTILISLLPSLLGILLIIFFKLYLKLSNFSLTKTVFIHIFLYSSNSISGCCEVP